MNKPRVDGTVLVCNGQDKAPVPRSSPVFSVSAISSFHLRSPLHRGKAAGPSGITVPTSPAEEAAEQWPAPAFSQLADRVSAAALSTERAARRHTKGHIHSALERRARPADVGGVRRRPERWNLLAVNGGCVALLRPVPHSLLQPGPPVSH